MRPRKRLLLYCADAAELACVRYVLSTRLYAVAGVSTVEDARGAAGACAFDCVLVMHRLEPDYSESVVVALRAALPDVPSVLLVRTFPVQPSAATVVCMAGDVARLIDQVRILCLRRRGPEKRLGRVAGAM